jgi:DNA-binding MarR family transcriptional regulator
MEKYYSLSRGGMSVADNHNNNMRMLSYQILAYINNHNNIATNIQIADGLHIKLGKVSTTINRELLGLVLEVR